MSDHGRPTLAQVTAHLRERHGIRFFPVEEAYWSWGGTRLSQAEAKKLERFFAELSSGKPSPSKIQSFYEYISDRRISEVIHSMKADIISRSTWLAAQLVPSSGSVLDLGTHVGHGLLTLAALVPGPEYVGLDGFAPPLAEADSRARSEGLTQVRFECINLRNAAPTGQHDLILDLQTTQYLPCRAETWRGLVSALKIGGLILSIPPIGEGVAFRNHVRAMKGAGLTIRGMMPLFSSDRGIPSAMPVLLATHDDGEGMALDTLLSQFKDILNDFRQETPMRLAYREFEDRAHAWLDGMGLSV